MKKSFLGLVALALILVALSSCAQPGGTSGTGSVVGKWLMEYTDPIVLEMRDDGSFEEYLVQPGGEKGMTTRSGNYEVKNGEAVLYGYAAMAPGGYYKIGTATVKGDKLYLEGAWYVRFSSLTGETAYGCLPFFVSPPSDIPALDISFYFLYT